MCPPREIPLFDMRRAAGFSNTVDLYARKTASELSAPRAAPRGPFGHKKPRKQKNLDNANVSGRVARVRCISEGVVYDGSGSPNVGANFRCQHREHDR